MGPERDLGGSYLVRLSGVYPFQIGQAIEGYVLQPFLLGDKIGLPPVAVVFAILAGAQLAGFLGMLIALPVAAIIVVLLRHLRDYYQKSHWYDSKSIVIKSTFSGNVSVEIESSNVDVKLETEVQKSQQNAEKTGKIEIIDPK